MNKDSKIKKDVQCAELVSADIHTALKEIADYARSEHGICITALKGYGFLSGAAKFKGVVNIDIDMDDAS